MNRERQPRQNELWTHNTREWVINPTPEQWGESLTLAKQYTTEYETVLQTFDYR